MKREAIYEALFNLVSAAEGIKTKSRTLKHWSDVPASQQPAAFVVQEDQDARKLPGGPMHWTLRASIYLYCHEGNAKVPAATQLNRCLDSIEKILKPDFTGSNTLGGLVEDCEINGKVETDEGLLGPQSIAIVPIKIVVVNDE